MDGYARWSLPAVEPQPDRVPYVRHQVQSVLHLWELDDLFWVVELVVGELTGNVVRHAKTPFTVVLTWDGHLLRGEITDANPVRAVAAQDVSAEATSGRGLVMVSAATDRWGCDPHPYGKTVWFELTRA